jgi:uncharacterized membrane protein
MQHRGEIIKKAIQESGYSITKLALDLNKSRSWMYQLFAQEKVLFSVIHKIGFHINYDFSKKIEDYNTAKSSSLQQKENSLINTAEHWKNKYINLLEEYNVLIKKSL